MNLQQIELNNYTLMELFLHSFHYEEIAPFVYILESEPLNERYSVNYSVINSYADICLIFLAINMDTT